MAKSRSYGSLIVILVILAAAGVGAWYFINQSEAKPPVIVTSPASHATLTQSVTATGALQAITTVDVSSQISGNIAKLYVDWNSPVKQGDPLADIDPSTYQTALLQSQAQLANATANYQLALVNAERNRALYAKNLIAKSDLDTIEAQLEQADAQVKIQTASNETAKVNLSRCKIFSPIDGLVMARNVDVGNTVAASLSAPVLFQIVNNLQKMQIAAAVSEADIGTIELKQNVRFTVDAFPNRQFRGVVTQIRKAPQTSQNVVTYQVIIEVNNADLKLLPGMTANVGIVVAQHNDVLRVPNAALRVRIADDYITSKSTPPAAAANGAPAAKPLSEEENRAKLLALRTELGITPASGRPTEEVMQKMRELAKERGIELPARMGGGARNADRDNGNGPITRTVYLLKGYDGKKPLIEAVTIKVGISDGVSSEVVDGLQENATVITSFSIPGAKTGAAASTPFGGGGGGGPGGPPRR